MQKDIKILISDLKRELNNEFELWYPLSIDTVNGGYFSDINYKWELEGIQNKMIVTQSRHVWSNANASIYYNKKEPYFKNAEHGFNFLKNVMWDKKFGGFYNLVNIKGEAVKENKEIIKLAYGDAFAIYGLAAYYKAFGDTSALNLAIKTFNWLEEHSYDPEYGGYFQFLTREGKPFKDGYLGNPPKDQNSSIHILESYAELYSVWKNEKLKDRLNSILNIICDTIIGNKGYMTLFFQRDWTPVSYRDSNKEVREKNYDFDHISFGHNVEIAYLMLEASDVLGIKDNSATIKVAKHLDDFAIQHGWDNKTGGIYDRGYIFNDQSSLTIIKDKKEWWCQIEALNSFLMMANLFPEENKYFQKFLEEWDHIKKYSIDKKYGGWFWDSVDTAPEAEKGPKASIWKANYHTSRGLINCIRQLEEINKKF